jgi:hypothetical protein
VLARSRRRTALPRFLGALVAVLLLPSVSSAAEPDDTVLTAGPALPDQTYVGELATPEDQDWYQVDVTRPLTAVRVGVRQTNEPCEAWFRLVTLDGLVLGQVVAGRGEARSIDVVTPSGGPYFVAVDNGPSTCAGAAYSLIVSLADAAPSFRTFAPRSRAGRPSRPNYLMCQTVSGRANYLAVAIHRTLRALHRASGGQKRRLRRKLRRSRREYRQARRQQLTWC